MLNHSCLRLLVKDLLEIKFMYCLQKSLHTAGNGPWQDYVLGTLEFVQSEFKDSQPRAQNRLSSSCLLSSRIWQPRSDRKVTERNDMH